MLTTSFPPHVLAVGIVHDRDPGTNVHGHLYFYDTKTARDELEVRRLIRRICGDIEVIMTPHAFTENDEKPVTGKFAAARAARYFTHEEREQQAKGKALYGDDEFVLSDGWQLTEWKSVRGAIDALNAYEGVEPARESKQSLFDRVVGRVRAGELRPRQVAMRFRKTYDAKTPSFWETQWSTGARWRADDERAAEQAAAKAAEVWRASPEGQQEWAEQHELIKQADAKARAEWEAARVADAARRAERDRVAEEQQRERAKEQVREQARRDAETARAREAAQRAHRERMATDPEYREQERAKQAARAAERGALAVEVNADLVKGNTAKQNRLAAELFALDRAVVLRSEELVQRAEAHIAGDEPGQCFDFDITGTDDAVTVALLARWDVITASRDVDGASQWRMPNTAPEDTEAMAARLLKKYVKRYA